jgi:ribosomal protein S27AE
VTRNQAGRVPSCGRKTIPKVPNCPTVPAKWGRVPSGRGTTILKMYCPRCGEPMVLINDRWECPVGEMRLSEKSQELIAHWCSTAPEPSETLRELSFNIGGNWWCPFDGSEMDWSPTHYPSCSHCGRTLTMTQIYPLVELHSHRAGPRAS